MYYSTQRGYVLGLGILVNTTIMCIYSYLSKYTILYLIYKKKYNAKATIVVSNTVSSYTQKKISNTIQVSHVTMYIMCSYFHKSNWYTNLHIIHMLS